MIEIRNAFKETHQESGEIQFFNEQKRIDACHILSTMSRMCAYNICNRMFQL